MTTFSIASINQAIGPGQADLRSTVLSTINLMTGLLTLVSLFMLTIAGFRWLTSGHNDEFKDQAKRMIRSAVIGEIIVLLAWTVVQFFARTWLAVSQ